MNKYLIIGSLVLLAGLLVSSTGLFGLSAITGGKGTFDFTLTNAGNKSVIAGESVTNTITATLVKGGSQNVVFSVSGVPGGVNASLSSGSCKPTCQTNLNLLSSVSTAPGNYTITVTGAYKSLKRTTKFTLTVNATFGDIKIKRVGSDDTISTAPVTSAWVDAQTSAATSTNPSDFASLNTGLHTVYTTDVADYAEIAGVCTYMVGSAECIATDLSITPSCNGTTCGVSVDVFKNQVTKVVVKYTSTIVASLTPPTPTPPPPTSSCTQPVITSLIPSSGPPSTSVQIVGNCFTPNTQYGVGTNNIKFYSGPGVVPSGSLDLNNAFLTADGYLTPISIPTWWPGSTGIGLAPGSYWFTVSNVNGTSAPVEFILTQNPIACQDGVDNDGDSLIDLPADLGCSTSWDNDETDPPPPLPPPTTPTLSLLPNSGTAGVRVTLSGNFFTANGNNIHFSPSDNSVAGLSANNVSTNPDGTLQFGVPGFFWPGYGSSRIWAAPGNYNFKVTNANGMNATGVYKLNSCSPPPTSTNPAIASISASSGPIGTRVDICAHYFTTINFALNQDLAQGVQTLTYPMTLGNGTGLYYFFVPSQIWSSAKGAQVPVTPGNYIFTVFDEVTKASSSPTTFTVTP